MSVLRLAKKHSGRVVLAWANQPETIGATKRRESISS
jgi:hypothetical protein